MDLKVVQDDCVLIIQAQSEEQRRLEDDLARRERTGLDILRRAQHMTKLRDEAQDQVKVHSQEIRDKDHVLERLSAELQEKEVELGQKSLAVDDHLRRLSDASKARDKAEEEIQRLREGLDAEVKLASSITERLRERETECTDRNSQLVQCRTQAEELATKTRHIEAFRQRIGKRKKQWAGKWNTCNSRALYCKKK